MVGIHSAGTIVNDFISTVSFGLIKGANFGIAVDMLTGNSAGVLANMHDHFLETALGRGTGPIERMMGSMSMIPPFLAMPSPMGVYPGNLPFCGCGYAGMQQMDLGFGSTNIPFFSKLFSPQRRAAANFEHLLRTNPYARAQFEASVGGRIVDFGIRTDGVFTVQRFAPGFHPGMALTMNPMAGTALGGLYGMEQSIMAQAGRLGMLGMGMPYFGSGSMFGNPFMGFTMGGMMNVAGMQYPAGAGFGPFDNSGALAGRGFGSWNPLAMPGRINNTNPSYEAAHQAETASLLADPSLTVEDKVTLLIMLIMKKMDKDIERQAQYINSIQQQQSSRGSQGGKGKGGGGVNGGPFGGPGGDFGNNSPSIDVETMKLKRMIDKRSQMFDMLRQIIDKYNQTAKGIIDSIGR
jgi:hypothetical protein